MSGRRLRGLGTKQGFLAPAQFHESTLEDCGLIDFSPADQVVEVGAGMAIAELQSLLGADGQCLP
ncbi:MAG: glycolate oxidase subunit GlcE, partial [Fimbriimonadaceae bacterium]